jgi:hypothetical protein
MNTELKMLVHDMIEFATQALKRHDSNDKHWKVVLSLLRHRAKRYVELFEQLESEIEGDEEE